jgi:hypothetical protein
MQTSGGVQQIHFPVPFEAASNYLEKIRTNSTICMLTGSTRPPERKWRQS